MHGVKSLSGTPRRDSATSTPEAMLKNAKQYIDDGRATQRKTGYEICKQLIGKKFICSNEVKAEAYYLVGIGWAEAHNNIKKAFEYIKPAAILRHQEAINYLIQNFTYSGEPDEQVIQLLQGEAEKGSALAKYELGKLYAAGRGVLQDEKLAAALFNEAAQLGIHQAKYELSIMYSHGRGVTQDVTYSQTLLIDAAHECDLRAKTLYKAGQLSKSRGDITGAIKLFMRAGDKKYLDAFIELALLFNDLGSKGEKFSKEMPSLDWYAKWKILPYSENKMVAGCINRAYMYDHAGAMFYKGVACINYLYPKNKPTYISSLISEDKLIEQECISVKDKVTTSACNLEELLNDGIHELNKASRKGHVGADYFLGMMYAEGDKVAKSETKYASHFTRAYNCGVAEWATEQEKAFGIKAARAFASAIEKRSTYETIRAAATNNLNTVEMWSQRADKLEGKDNTTTTSTIISKERDKAKKDMENLNDTL